MDFSDSRKLKMIFCKSGSNSLNTRLCIPISWCHSMDITENDRLVTCYYDDVEKSITIKKFKQ